MASNKITDGLSKEQTALRKKMLFVISIAMFFIYSLLCFALAPLGESLLADIAYSNSILTAIVSYLCTLCELLALSFFYGVLIYCIYRLGLNHFKAGLGIFAAATAYKYLGNKIVSWIRYGSIPKSVFADLGDVLFFVVLEAVQLFIILLFVCHVIDNFKLETQVLKPIGKEPTVYPFGKLYDRKNPLMKSAFLTGLIVCVSKFIGQPLSDLTYIIMSGLPKDPDTVPAMLLSYLTTLIYSLICGAICYVVQLLLLSELIKKHGEF